MDGSQYPTGPAVVAVPMIDSPAHPALVCLYIFWGVVAVDFAAFAAFRASWVASRQTAEVTTAEKEGTKAADGRLGGFGGLAAKKGSADSAQQEERSGSPRIGAHAQAGSITELDSASPPRGSSNKDVRLELPDNNSSNRRYYQDSAFGSCSFVLYILFMVHLYGIFVILLIDSYWECQFKHVDAMCFKGSHPIFGDYAINSYIFFVVWHTVLFSYGASLAKKTELRNWFRLPCEPKDAEHVWIWSRMEEEVRVDERQLSPVVKFLSSLKARVGVSSTQSHEETVAVHTTAAGSRCYEFQGSRFILSATTNQFTCSEFELGFSLADLHKCSDGLPEATAVARLDRLGHNEIPFKVDTIPALLGQEFFSYFYVYQLLMYMVWLWYSYLVTGAIVFAVVIFSGIMKVMVTRTNQLSMQKLTQYNTSVMVLRDSEWTLVKSPKLVPGDIIRIQGGWTMPCDAVILHGAAVCNESTLTGEPMPLQKVQAPPDDDRKYDPQGRGSRYTLFAGTMVLQAGSVEGEQVLAVVTGTGMNTSKGEIMSAILFPSRITFKYTAELPAVLIILFCYAGLNFALSLYLVLNNGSSSSSWVTYWTSAVFTVSQILSPLLPVALVAGQIKATDRLKAQGVFCLNPSHIPICGKIRVFCFDKTGTLTREGLDFLGFWPITSTDASSGGPKFGPGMIGSQEGTGGGWGETGLRALASCHAVAIYEDDFVGNQLEVAMFKATDWTMSEGEHQRTKILSPDGKDELTTVRRFEFDHGRQAMSVVVRDKSGNAHAYVKGSFERVGQMADPSSIPDMYLPHAQALALDGCYVLAIAHRPLGVVSDEELAHMTRDEVESGGAVIGLMAFRNELKEDSARAILELRGGDVRTVMITGDNAMCGLYIAKQAGMGNPKAKMLLAESVPSATDGHGPNAKSASKEAVVWRAMGSESSNTYETAQLYQGPLAKQLANGELELAVSGAAYGMLDHSGDMEKLLLYTRIFARLSPELKVDVVRLLQAKGLVVGMCGDGGNDCGALRVAHAGIALSDAEASVVASFTSKSKSCMSVVDLIREGRAALHQSLAAYKFLITYGQLFSLMKVVMFSAAVVPSRLFYFSTDVVGVLFMTWSMNFSKPHPQLAPERPTSSLLGANTMFSVLGLHLINASTFVTVVWTVFSHPDYVPWPTHLVEWKDNWLHADNWEATAISFPMYILFISSGMIFSFGHKFRRPVYTNINLMVVYVFLLGLQVYLLLSEPNAVTRWWHVASEAFNAPGTSISTWAAYQAQGGQPSSGMPFDLRLQMLVITLCGASVGALWQVTAVDGFGRQSCASVFPGNRPRLVL